MFGRPRVYQTLMSFMVCDMCVCVCVFVCVCVYVCCLFVKGEREREMKKRESARVGEAFVSVISEQQAKCLCRPRS